MGSAPARALTAAAITITAAANHCCGAATTPHVPCRLQFSVDLRVDLRRR